MTTAPTAIARKKLRTRIAVAQKQADAARKDAKTAKAGFKRAKQEFKDARRAARKLRKAVKALKVELAALAVKRVRRKPAGAKSAAPPAPFEAVALSPEPVAAETSSPPESPPAQERDVSL